jgi:hypothetical protein
MYMLAEFVQDPQAMIDNIALFTNTYIWSANSVSLLLMDTPGDTASAHIYNAESARFICNEKNWDLKNETSIAQRLMKEKEPVYYKFILLNPLEPEGYFRIDNRINDLIEVFSKGSDIGTTRAYGTLEVNDKSLTTRDLDLIFQKRSSPDRDYPHPFSCLLIPIYTGQNKVKGIVFLSFNHHAVMGSEPGFTEENLWDAYCFMNALKTIYREA